MPEPLFHNIFSKRKPSQKVKPKIIVDNREKNSLVVAELIALENDIEWQQLQIGDYLINNTAVERKTAQDLISSIFNKRIFSQIDNLKQYPSKILIIENLEAIDNEPGINKNILRGFFLSSALDNIPILFSQNQKETAQYLSLLAKKETKESTLRAKPQITNSQHLQFILEGFPGIGPATARKLLEKYKTLKSIINAPEEEIKELLGKKSEKFLTLLNQEYKPAPI